MGKTRDQHEKAIVKVIKDNNLMYISHIFGIYTDLCSAQFYNLGLEKSEKIKEAIATNRGRARARLLRNWENSENPTLQICAYRLIATPDEYDRLTQSKIEAKVGNIGKEPFRIVTSEDAAGEIARLQED